MAHHGRYVKHNRWARRALAVKARNAGNRCNPYPRTPSPDHPTQHARGLSAVDLAERARVAAECRRLPELLKAAQGTVVMVALLVVAPPTRYM